MPQCWSSAESHLEFLDSIVRSAERLCKGELCCLGHRKKVSALCLVYRIYHRVEHPMGYKIYHRVNNPMNEFLSHFVADRS